MRTALYVRISSDRQDIDLSTAAQLRALREYAARNGHTVVREFVDQAETGRTAYRPQFREMISLARRADRPFDLILVYKYSRFARSREDSIVYKALLKKSGVQLISITEPVDDSAVGRLMQAIIECIDEFYSENLGEEVTRGMRESASRGFYLSSRAPYGLKKVKVNDGAKERTRLELEEAKSGVVATAFDRVLKREGLMEIIKDFESKGIPGPGGKGWSKTSLHKMLANEVYTGTIVWGRNSKRGLPPVRVENACPAIVSREVFEEAHALLGQRAFIHTHPRRVSSQFLLSGLVRCGHCGKALIGMNAKSGEFSYYVCGTLTKKGAGSCPSRYQNSKKLEGQVIDQIRENIVTPENLTLLAEEVMKEMNGSSEANKTELNTIDGEIGDTDRRLGRLYEVIETGKVLPEDVGPRIRELNEQRRRLQERKEELLNLVANQSAEAPSLEEVTECARDLRNILEQGSLAEQKAFIRSFVQEITVLGEEARLTYIPPEIPPVHNGETEPVLSIVRHGGR
jgi:DNA invertase Pin-like site-specific DNA recombinase